MTQGRGDLGQQECAHPVGGAWAPKLPAVDDGFWPKCTGREYGRERTTLGRRYGSRRPLPAAAPEPDPFNLRKRGSEIQGNNCTQRLTDRQTEQTQGAPLEAAHEAARLQAPTTETLVQKRSWRRLKL